MISEKFIILAILFNLTGSLSYVRSTLAGRTKPNRVTWFLWMVVPLITFAAQIGEGVGPEAAVTFMAGFGPTLVFFASFVNKRAYWKLSLLDIVCGVLSVLAVILWLITGDGLIAIALGVLADLLAAIPTLIKAYTNPETENATAFRNSAVAATIGLLVIDSWSFESASFALYVLVICIVFYTLIRFKVGPKLSAKN